MIVNKTNPNIYTTATGKDQVFMSLPNLKDVYFSSGATEMFKLKPGRYLHFDHTDGHWSFFQNDDPDGFLLHQFGFKGVLRLRVINKSLVQLIRKTTQFKDHGVRFFLVWSDLKVNGSRMVDIITSKTYQQMMKQ